MCTHVSLLERCCDTVTIFSCTCKAERCLLWQGEEDLRLPDMVQQYHSLYPLEDLTTAREKASQAFGMKTTLLKGVSSRDGQAYTLRRVDNRRVRLCVPLPSRVSTLPCKAHFAGIALV